MAHMLLSHIGQSKSRGQVQGQCRGILQGKEIQSHGDKNKLVVIITPVYHSMVLWGYGWLCVPVYLPVYLFIYKSVE